MKENKKKYSVLLLHPNNHFSKVAFGILKELEKENVIVLYENNPENHKYDFLLSVCYPSRIKDEDRQRAQIASLNIHTGLLPRHRGSNPLNWALIWGDDKVGVTLHYMVDTYDAGDVVLQKTVLIEDNDNIRDLQRKTKEVLPELIRGFFKDPEFALKNSWKQNQAQMTYAQKRRPEDSELNLNAPARDIYNLWRSCDPDEYPAFVMENGKKKIVEKVEKDGTIIFRN